MPRQIRDDRAGQIIYQALNRGYLRQTIFKKDAYCEAFLRVLAVGLEMYSVDIFLFTLMPIHRHIILRTGQDGQIGQLMRWVTSAHSLRYHGHYQTRGGGHLYQARFKSFPVQDDEHFCVACRYVERNPLRAGLVKSARDWRHTVKCEPCGSLS